MQLCYSCKVCFLKSLPIQVGKMKAKGVRNGSKHQDNARKIRILL